MATHLRSVQSVISPNDLPQPTPTIRFRPPEPERGRIHMDGNVFVTGDLTLKGKSETFTVQEMQETVQQRVLSIDRVLR